MFQDRIAFGLWSLFALLSLQETKQNLEQEDMESVQLSEQKIGRECKSTGGLAVNAAVPVKDINALKEKPQLITRTMGKAP